MVAEDVASLFLGGTVLLVLVSWCAITGATN